MRKVTGSTDSADAGIANTIREENVNISADTANMQCYIAYDDRIKGPRPLVLIVPEWWGLNEYPKTRAKQLAQLGYFALAIDLYGSSQLAFNPEQAMKMAGEYYANPQMATGRIGAALAKAKTYEEADSTKTAAIGYCFGGSMVLNAAKLGLPVDGVVSFHGGLAGVAPAKNTIKSKILVCHGMADPFVPEQDVVNFKNELDAIGAEYIFKEYPDAMHAFTNPDATENGKKFNIPIAYNAEADKNSWEDMKAFFATLWK